MKEILKAIDNFFEKNAKTADIEIFNIILSNLKLSDSYVFLKIHLGKTSAEAFLRNFLFYYNSYFLNLNSIELYFTKLINNVIKAEQIMQDPRLSFLINKDKNAFLKGYLFNANDNNS